MADRFRWCNRWHATTPFAQSDMDRGKAMVANLHSTPFCELALPRVAGVDAAIEWGVRVVVRR